MKSLAVASWRWGIGVILIGGLFMSAACQKRQPHGGVVRFGQKTPPKPIAAPVVHGPSEPDERYQNVVLPILIKHGCAAGACHSPTRGGGFQFLSIEKNDVRTYRELLTRINRQDPASSELLLKSTRKVPHNGGLSYRESSCDYKRIFAWIGNLPDIDCNDDPPPDPARFAREVAPALSAMGCVSCHGSAPSARGRFDLSSLSSTPPRPEMAREAIAATQPSSYMTWTSKVIVAANGDAKHPQKIDPRSCAYRRLYGYLTNAPELHCELDTAAEAGKSAAQMPDFPRFADKVLPAIAKRGCFESGCHGGGAGGMTLYGNTDGGSKGWHEYLQLTARIEDLAHPEKSTFITTARNEQPHGGGERLGGTGDCVDEEVMSWLLNRPRGTCKPPSQPTFERFVKEVQPVFDQMTCTQRRCHGESLPAFVLKRHPATQELLMANYRAALREIDLEFMPFSGIQLRMREPCAYSVVGAWITGKPKPSCVVHDPDPKIFPKMEDDIRAKSDAQHSPT